jgi:Ulp1 family protease
MSSSNDHTAKEIQGKFRIFFHENIHLTNCHCPQQENGFDCGLYLIVIVEEFCRFVHESYLLKSSNEDKYDKKFFEKFSNEIHRCITSKFINQRRKELKTLLQSMSINRNQ